VLFVLPNSLPETRAEPALVRSAVQPLFLIFLHDVRLCTTTDGYHNRHYTGRFQVLREDQVDQEIMDIGTVNKKDLRKMTLPGKKQRWQLLTDKNGVGLWPNASTWMRVESRSRSRSCMTFGWRKFRQFCAYKMHNVINTSVGLYLIRLRFGGRFFCGAP